MEGHRPQFFRIEPLGSQHSREDFSSGESALDTYLRRQAGQDIRKRVATAFVVTADGRTIAGYYTLSQFAVELELIPDELAKRLPKYPWVPATLLGRLAVGLAFRGRGLGKFLLMDALCRALQGSRQVASAAVVVDAKDSAAASFYGAYGFLEMDKVPGRLLLPMTTIERSFPGV